MPEIQQIAVAAINRFDKVRQIKLGVSLTDNHIDIFALEPIVDTEMDANLAWICDQLLEALPIEHSLSDCAWTYTIAPHSTTFSFTENHGLATSITINDIRVFEPYCIGAAISEYMDAISSSDGLKQSMQSHYAPGSFEDIQSTTLHLAYTPRRTRRLHSLENPLPNYVDDLGIVVNVDSERFMEYWLKQSAPKTTGIFPRFGGSRSSLDVSDHKLLTGSIEESLKYTIPFQMASTVVLDYENKVRFNGGRHRTVNIFRSGAPYIPLHTVMQSNYDEFLEKFEWTG